jgi:hypothetical protein
MAVIKNNARHHFHYVLSHGKNDELRLFLSKKQAADLYAKLGKALTAKRSRGHRTYHVSFFHNARLWSKLHVTTHAAHRRHCADREASKKWVTE